MLRVVQHRVAQTLKARYARHSEVLGVARFLRLGGWLRLQLSPVGVCSSHYSGQPPFLALSHTYKPLVSIFISWFHFRLLSNFLLNELSLCRKQREYANKIKPIRKNGHLLLVTLLLANMIVNETLPVISDPVFGGGIYAVIFSTILIVMYVVDLSIPFPHWRRATFWAFVMSISSHIILRTSVAWN